MHLKRGEKQIYIKWSRSRFNYWLFRKNCKSGSLIFFFCDAKNYRCSFILDLHFLFLFFPSLSLRLFCKSCLQCQHPSINYYSDIEFAQRQDRIYRQEILIGEARLNFTWGFFLCSFSSNLETYKSTPPFALPWGKCFITSTAFMRNKNNRNKKITPEGNHQDMQRIRRL